jgi:predicted nucleic-acid-binding protein
MGGPAVKITADTNVLERAMMGDDARQGALAQDELAGAELVAVTLPTLCELVWVLSRATRFRCRILSSRSVACLGPPMSR